MLQLAPDTAALQLLGLLQREARFIDFVEEDIAAYSDADIGAASRLLGHSSEQLTEHVYRRIGQIVDPTR